MSVWVFLSISSNTDKEYNLRSVLLILGVCILLRVW
jgi:hypothetical protein